MNQVIQGPKCKCIFGNIRERPAQTSTPVMNPAIPDAVRPAPRNSCRNGYAHSTTTALTGAATTRLKMSEITNVRAANDAMAALISADDAGGECHMLVCTTLYSRLGSMVIVKSAARATAPASADTQAASNSARATGAASPLLRDADAAMGFRLRTSPRHTSARRKVQVDCTTGLFLTTIAYAALFCLLALASSCAAEIAPQNRRSGYADMSPESKAMQDDDTANPGTLAVLDGEALWNRKTGAADISCAGCHGDAASSMKGVAARYPAFDVESGKPVDIDERINLERTRRQKAPPLKNESADLLALSAYVSLQSRGEPVAPPDDERLAPFTAAGRDFFNKRQGQLNLSCALCHDDNWGRRLAGNIVPQGHPNGYPLYRLEWQSMGSLQRRLRNCISGMRAEVPEYGSSDYVNLELFLMRRAAGMTMESPAVRP